MMRAISSRVRRTSSLCRFGLFFFKGAVFAEAPDGDFANFAVPVFLLRRGIPDGVLTAMTLSLKWNTIIAK
jgi:hypothetical protein